MKNLSIRRGLRDKRNADAWRYLASKDEQTQAQSEVGASR